MIQVRFSRGCSNGWCGWGRQEREQGRGNKTRGIAGPVRAPGFEMRQLLLAVIPSAARDLAGLLPKEILRCARDDSHIRCLFLPDPALAPLAVRSLNGVRSHGRARSEERRVGKEGVSSFRFRWPPLH